MLTREQIVEVAKDVLEQIRVKKIVAESGVYLSVSEVPAGITDLQQVAKSPVPCFVCARGALILSKANLFNDCPIGATYRGPTDLGPHASFLSRRDFPDDIWAKCEAAFEGEGAPLDTEEWLRLDQGIDYDVYGEYGEDEDTGRSLVFAKYEEFKESYPDDGYRLIAIMNNLIANNGYFKL